ncbi:MAG TPA: amidase [Candidatus Eisenbacteria bacterium]|nr:amidase [Candidatus Eisenbacteria bacterium]
MDSPIGTIREIGAAFRRGAISPTAVVERCFARIDAIDPALRSFLRLTRDRALEEARVAEAALRAGVDMGPLQGIPYAAKELFDVAGEPSTAGTHLLAHRIAREDAEAVRRLASAGMALLGKTHTVQLAYGMVGVNNDQGTPRNPWSRVPHATGGSSSGSAAAVAAGLVPVALGTDTGGSVRVPAALCGVVGLKTTVGQVSRAGVHTLSWTLDSVGPIARTVEDAALVYQELQGADSRDSATSHGASRNVLSSLEEGVRGLRLRFAETLFFHDVDPEVERAVRDTGEVFRSLGADVASMEVPEIAEAWTLPKRALLIASEGIAVNRQLFDEHFDELDPVVALRMAPGRELAAVDYLILLRSIAELRDRILTRLHGIDALLVPTAMVPARPLEGLSAPTQEYFDYNLKLNRNAGLGNLLDLCGISVPCGLTKEGLPIGLMIYAAPFREDLALRIAHAYERGAPWRARMADLSWALAPTLPTT